MVGTALSVLAGTPKPGWARREPRGSTSRTLTLKAAGLDAAGSGEARNTWLEILGQSLSGMARSIGARVGREVNCEAGVERAPGPEGRHRAWLGLSFTGSALEPLVVALSAKLVDLISSPAEIGAEGPGAGSAPPLQNPVRKPNPSPRARARSICCWMSSCR